MRYSADMVVVRVSDDYADNVFFFAPQVADIGDDVINARHIFFRELQTYIDDKNVVAVFQDAHIAADFFQAAQRENAQAVFGRRTIRFMPLHRRFNRDGAARAMLRAAVKPPPASRAARSRRFSADTRPSCLWFL